MDIENYFGDFRLFCMILSFLVCVFLYLWLSIIQNNRIRMMSLKTYCSAEDLLDDLRIMKNDIPRAIVRGYVKARNLKILDHMSEGVLRQKEMLEVYEKSGEKGDIVEERITTIDELESVEFGIVELVGNNWLIEEAGPPEEFACAMKQVHSDVKHFTNCPKLYRVFRDLDRVNETSQLQYRMLTKVKTTVRMLVMGEPITILGKITVNDLGNIQIGRSESDQNYLISTKSPEALTRQTGTELMLILALTICASTGLLFGVKYSWDAVQRIID